MFVHFLYFFEITTSLSSLLSMFNRDFDVPFTTIYPREGPVLGTSAGEGTLA